MAKWDGEETSGIKAPWQEIQSTFKVERVLCMHTAISCDAPLNALGCTSRVHVQLVWGTVWASVLSCSSIGHSKHAARWALDEGGLWMKADNIYEVAPSSDGNAPPSELKGSPLIRSTMLWIRMKNLNSLGAYHSSDGASGINYVIYLNVKFMRFYVRLSTMETYWGHLGKRMTG